MKKGILFITLLLFSNLFYLYAQSDSLVLNNGNVIVGEAKELKKGVLTMKTNYSDSDFKIEWLGIKEIFTESYYTITMSYGTIYYGRLITSKPNRVLIIEGTDSLEVNFEEVVYLKSIDTGFWSRFYASIDLGYSFTKASNLHQLSMRGNLGYFAEKWSIDASFGTVASIQDSVESIRRTDGGLTYKYSLPKAWYIFTQLTFLSNTEQKLDLRVNTNLGIGKYLIQTNKVYWGVQGGASLNNESFSTDDEDRQSLEAFFGTELNLFDIGDLSLLTKGYAYPSLTESGRWRADFALDLKYDLPLDFYLKLGLNYNFDNRPVEGASETDYVFQLSFGWEL